MREKRLADKKRADEEKYLNEMKGVTFKPQVNKRSDDVKAQVPPHTASQSSLGAVSFGGKNQTYQQKYQIKQALNKSESDSQKQSESKSKRDSSSQNKAEVIQDFLADVLPSQSQSIVEAA